ncbi:MAG TPA: SMC-Scp complex subunit ScpB, partial [Polyangiaceae bacterium]|nr:SMC-Scp complex subunit ScpB [Polyangiaceae bacterium]
MMSDETTTEVEPEGTEREAESTEREADGEPEAAEAALIGEAEGVVDEGEIADTGVFLKGLIEALIFVSDKPLELKEIARGARVDRARAGELLDEIRRDYEERGLSLTEVAGGYAFRSNPLYAERLRHYLSLRPTRLSRAQLETLAIVAYRQPITRPEIDDIRGVDSGPVLKGLLERDLIRIIGKKDEPGRPMLYGTTPSFLEAFSLKSLRDLPTLREYTELSEESRQTFESELGEAAPEGPIEDPAAAPGSENAQALADAMLGATSGESEAPAMSGVMTEAGEGESESKGEGGGDEGEASDGEEDESDEDEDESDDEDDDEDDDDEDEDDESDEEESAEGEGES